MAIDSSITGYWSNVTGTSVSFWGFPGRKFGRESSAALVFHISIIVDRSISTTFECGCYACFNDPKQTGLPWTVFSYKCQAGASMEGSNTRSLSRITFPLSGALLHYRSAHVTPSIVGVHCSTAVKRHITSGSDRLTLVWFAYVCCTALHIALLGLSRFM